MTGKPEVMDVSRVKPGSLASYICGETGERVLTRVVSEPTVLPIDGNPMVVSVEASHALVPVENLELANGADIEVRIRLPRTGYCKPIDTASYFENASPDMIASLSMNDWQGDSLSDKSFLCYAAKKNSCTTYRELEQMPRDDLEGARFELDTDALEAWLEYWRPDVVDTITAARAAKDESEPETFGLT